MKKASAIQKELAIAGVPKRVRNSGEVQALSNILEPDETVLGCMQGLYSEGLGIIVATSTRLLVVNKSFLWTRVEDESYAVVNHVKYKKGILFGKVTLSSRGRKYVFNVLNSDPISSFTSVIDNKMRYHGQLK